MNIILHSEKQPGNGLLKIASGFLPHDTRRTTCPPAALVGADGPLIIVPSLMRSGTHLLLDTLFNNFPALRRKPLFVDFDAYRANGLHRQLRLFASINGIVIKTHFPLQVPLAGPLTFRFSRRLLRARLCCGRIVKGRESANRLQSGTRIIRRRNLRNWRKIFENFWVPYSPLIVDFTTLLNSDGVARFIEQVKKKTGLQIRVPFQPVMPARSRVGIYMDKILTRAFGCKVPRVNTTIGYRLKPKSLE